MLRNNVNLAVVFLLLDLQKCAVIQPTTNNKLGFS